MVGWGWREYVPRDPADRLSHRPGDQVQCALWFPPIQLPLGQGQHGSTPVTVAAFSRLITTMMISNPHDLVSVDLQLEAVPRQLF